MKLEQEVTNIRRKREIHEIRHKEISKEFFDEQNWLIDKFLKDRDMLPNKVTSLNYLNQIIKYILEDESANRLFEVTRLLLQSFGYYGSKQGEEIADEQITAVIAFYMNQVILGNSIEEWLLQHEPQKSQAYSYRPFLNQRLSFNNQDLKKYLLDFISSPHSGGQLSNEAYVFYCNFVLRMSIPTLTMQLNITDSAELSRLSITGARWGFIHAGALLLSDYDLDLNKYRLNDFEEIGLLLHVSISEGTVSQLNLKYFRLPALLMYAKHHGFSEVSMISDFEMQKIFMNYFEHIERWEKLHNPLIRLPELINSWRKRSELARAELTKYHISHEYITSYLNRHSETKFKTSKGYRAYQKTVVADDNLLEKIVFKVSDGDVTLPNIDEVFEEQNRKLADTAYEVDKLLLPAAFNTLNETDQQFIALSKVDRVRIQFNAQDSIKSAPLPPGARMAIVQNDKFVYRVPDHIDLLSCTQNDIERIYVLESSDRKISYTLYRVDRDRKALLQLLDDMTIPSRDPDYKIIVTSHLTLKEPGDGTDRLIDALSEYHRTKLFAELQEKGYDKTTLDKFKDFSFSLIPFYTCISESISGDELEAINACIIDVAGLVPFAGQSGSTFMRFSTALGRSTTMALSYAARQSTIKAMIKQFTKQTIKYTPLAAEKISPKVLRELGIGFLRGVDPGLELLATGGVKGLQTIQNVISYIPKKSLVMRHLVDAIKDYQSNIASLTDKNRNLSIKSLFSPYHGKLLNVAVVGEEGGKQIWVQVDQETNQFFGQKFTLNADSQLEIMPVDMGHRNDPQKGLSSSGSYSSKQESYTSDHEPWVDGVKSIGKSVVKQYLADTSYIQYLTKIPFHKKDSQVLVVSAHGGYLHSDAKSPPVMIPIDVTVKLLTPHNTMLLDPGLDEIVNAGENLKVYCTIKEGVIENIEFEPQNGNPKWLYKDDYDPAAVENALGHKDGLQNYRHYRYEGESDSMIASVLRKNRKLANKGEAVLTDVLTLRKEVYCIGDTSLEETSVQKVLDLHKQGLLVNEVGASYKTIIFSHCRNCYQHLLRRTSVYVTKREHLDSFLDPESSPKGMESEPLIITVLHRENLSREFQIKHIAIGRIIYRSEDSALKYSQNSTNPSRSIRF